MEPSNKNRRFVAPVEELLKKAGWYDGRDVLSQLTLPREFERFEAADNILREFGGLKIGKSGRGIEEATSDLELEPSFGEHLKEDLATFSKRLGLGGKLYPLGEVQCGHAYLIAHESGRIYHYFDELEKIADSFDRALQDLLLGLKPKADSGQS